MSEAKFTDERWWMEFDADIHITTDGRDKQGKVPIADIQVGFDEPFESEQFANAMLIARSRDMYKFIHRLIDDSQLDLGWREEAEKLLAECRGET